MVTGFFISSLLVTFIIARFTSHAMHDRFGYGTPYDKSKTLTGWLRRKTGFDWHHYHFGFIVVFLSLFLSYFFGFNSFIMTSLGIGASLFLDQISFLIFMDKNYFRESYFGLRSLVISAIFHLAVTLLFLSVNAS